MQKLYSPFLKLSVAASALLLTGSLLAQGVPLPVEVLPLGKDIGISSGQTVTPAYEGWYIDDDGMKAFSFGYYNRNSEQVLQIPVGPANRIIGAPDGNPDQGQPTQFDTERHWGVFTVKVPADYEGEVVWHLENQGKTFHIGANPHVDYVIDAIVGDAGGNLPARVRFSQDSAWGHGPAGTAEGPIDARTGRALTLNAYVEDDGKGSGLASLFLGGGGTAPPGNVDWFKHRGPGKVEFSEANNKIPATGGTATTEVTFSEPGEYVLRVRVTDFAGPEMAGHSQCCWSNGFLKVNVR